MLNLLVLFFFPLMMAYAASSDLLTMRITNRLVLVLLAGFAVIAIFMPMPLNALSQHLAAGGLVLVAAFGLFSLGWIGGGDAKLAAATSLWIGLPLVLPYLVYSALLGGGLTLLILAARQRPLPAQLATVTWIDRLHDKNTGIPYGIALAAGGLLIYSQTAIFQHFAG